MAEEKLLTVRDAALILGISEKEVMDLAEQGIIPAYKVGGVYLRFKPQQIEEYKKQRQLLHPPSRLKASFKEGLSDFFYFNDFYILSVLLILLLLVVILRG